MSMIKESFVDFEQVNLSSVINSLTAGSITAGSLHVSGSTTLTGSTTLNSSTTLNGSLTLTGATTLNGPTTLDGLVVYGNAETSASTLIITSGTPVNYPGVVMTASPAITFGIISSGVFGQQMSVYAPNITAASTNFTVTGIVNGGSTNSANVPRYALGSAPITGLSAQLLCITDAGQFRWMLT